MAVKSSLSPVILCVLFLSCRHHPQQTAATPLRDSLAREYLHGLDSVGNDDTASTAVRVLRSYLSNDTGFLKKLENKRLQAIATTKEERAADSCVHQARLQDMKIDRGYRFIFSEAFCRDRLNITITKVKDSINLHYILYTSNYRYDGSGGGSKIKKEYDRLLTRPQWDSLDWALYKADFWTLNTPNERRGVDGDDIGVFGYRSFDDRTGGAPRLHVVYRWAVSSTPLGDPFRYVLRLSGGLQGCIYLD